MELLILNAVVFLAGGFAGYFTSYLKQKGQNRALKEDIVTLENQKKEIENNWNIKLEETKKSHNLEIEHRKYQYEEKRRLYSEFCAELDRYQSKGQDVLKEKALPMISKFLTALEQANEKRQVSDGFSQYFNDMLLLCNELSASFVEMKNQTNKLRLVTSDETENLLDLLTSNLQKLTDSGNEMLRYLATQEGMTDQAGQKMLGENLITLGEENQIIRKNLIKQMKDELSRI